MPGLDPARVLAEARRRLEARWEGIVLAAVLSAAFVLVGNLAWTVALAGFAAVLAWALFALDPRVTRLPPLAESETGGSAAPVWQAMLTAFPEPVLLLDADDTVLAANAACDALFPVTRRAHVSRTSRAPEIGTAIAEARRTGEPHTFGLRIPLPVERHLAGLVAPLGGRPPEPSLMLVLRDQTEGAQLAEMRADFVANASHELRTPLASLKGFVETLQGAARDDAQARDRFLAIMAGEASRMSHLIDDLLSLSRVEMREHVAPTERVDLGGIARAAMAALKPLADAAGIALAEPQGPCWVLGDHDELTQVVQNLVENAIKYGRRGGHVRVQLTSEAQAVVLAVEDDGLGIAPEHLPRLTERFYRVNATQSRARGGTGLGLAIVKHVINRHRGELAIASTPGQGSTFTVRLPRPPAGATRAKPDAVTKA